MTDLDGIKIVCALRLLKIWINELILRYIWIFLGPSQVALVVKKPPANAGDIRDMGLIPGSERYPGEGNGKPLQYSYLENPMNSMKRQNDRILKEKLPKQR